MSLKEALIVGGDLVALYIMFKVLPSILPWRIPIQGNKRPLFHWLVFIFAGIGVLVILTEVVLLVSGLLVPVKINVSVDTTIKLVLYGIAVASYLLCWDTASTALLRLFLRGNEEDAAGKRNIEVVNIVGGLPGVVLALWLHDVISI